MPRQISPRNGYERAPDGLPARVVGRWVERKAFYTDRYAAIFSVGMKNRWPRRCYIELFAGPGVSVDRSSGRFVPGSALLAMEHPFTDFLFVDIDKTAASALRQRAEQKRGTRNVWVRAMDCNRAIGSIMERIPDDAISLAFVDPTAAQVRFSTIAQLANRRVDLLFTFHVGAFRRAVSTRARDIEAFFPPHADWRGALRLPLERQIPALVNVYQEGLKSHGYQQAGTKWVSMRNSRNVLMYVLVLFTKHPRGQEFWQKAIAEEETGQTRLFPWL
jgi:three-Cys-motif partner protein